MSSWYRLVKQAEPILIAEGDYRLRMVCYHVLQQASWETGRRAESVDYGRKGIALTREAGDGYAGATYNFNVATKLAEAPHLAQDGEEALRLATSALAIAEASGNRYIQAAAPCLIGDLTGGVEAGSHYEVCLERSRGLDDPLEIGYALRESASHLATQDPARGYALIDEALDLARRIGDRWELAMARVTRANMSWRAGTTDGLSSPTGQERNSSKVSFRK